MTDLSHASVSSSINGHVNSRLVVRIKWCEQHTIHLRDSVWGTVIWQALCRSFTQIHLLMRSVIVTGFTDRSEESVIVIELENEGAEVHL